MFDRRKRSNSFNFNALGTDKIVLHGRTTVTSNQFKFIIFTTSRYTCQFYVLFANNNGRRLVIIIHHRIALMRFKGEIQKDGQLFKMKILFSSFEHLPFLDRKYLQYNIKKLNMYTLLMKSICEIENKGLAPAHYHSQLCYMN